MLAGGTSVDARAMDVVSCLAPGREIDEIGVDQDTCDRFRDTSIKHAPRGHMSLTTVPALALLYIVCAFFLVRASMRQGDT